MANYKEVKERLILPESVLIDDSGELIVRDFKGVWLKKELFLDKSLNPAEMILLAEIDSLNQGEGCYASNEYLGTKIKVSTGRCANIISALKKRGYIEQIRIDGRKRWIRVKAEFTNSLKQSSQIRESRVHENVKIDNSIDTSLEKEKNRSIKSIDPFEATQKVEANRNTPTNRNGLPSSPRFEEFWHLQLRKTGRAKCLRWWNKDYNPEEDQIIIDAWKKQRPLYAKRKTSLIPHPYTWLNEGRWEDDLDSINGKEVSTKSARELAIEGGFKPRGKLDD